MREVALLRRVTEIPGLRGVMRFCVLSSVWGVSGFAVGERVGRRKNKKGAYGKKQVNNPYFLAENGFVGEF